MMLMMMLRRVQYTTTMGGRQAQAREEKACVKLLFPVVRIDRPGTKLYLNLAWPRRAAVQQLLKPTYLEVRYDTIRCDVSRPMRHLDELPSFTLPKVRKVYIQLKKLNWILFHLVQYKTTYSLLDRETSTCKAVSHGDSLSLKLAHGLWCYHRCIALLPWFIGRRALLGTLENNADSPREARKICFSFSLSFFSSYFLTNLKQLSLLLQTGAWSRT